MSPATTERNSRTASSCFDKHAYPKAAALTLGVILGLVIWLLSHPLTGRREPWDAPGPYFLASLTIAGFIIGMLTGRRFWLGVAGLYVGQLAVMVLGPQQHSMERAPLALGMAALALFTLVGLVSAAASFGLRWFVTRCARRVARQKTSPGPPAA